MSNGVYVGSGETAHKVAGMYIGVDGLARKVVKGYIGAGGLARQFYSAAQPFAYTYTGDYTEAERVIDGVAYTVLTITSSGTLTVNRAISADVWLCGGGGNGASGNGASRLRMRRIGLARQLRVNRAARHGVRAAFGDGIIHGWNRRFPIQILVIPACGHICQAGDHAGRMGGRVYVVVRPGGDAR